jgi:hypothetical protein
LPERPADPSHRFVEQQIFGGQLAIVKGDGAFPRGRLISGQLASQRRQGSGKRLERGYATTPPGLGEQHVVQIGPERAMEPERERLGDELACWLRGAHIHGSQGECAYEENSKAASHAASLWFVSRARLE